MYDIYEREKEEERLSKVELQLCSVVPNNYDEARLHQRKKNQRLVVMGRVQEISGRVDFWKMVTDEPFYIPSMNYERARVNRYRTKCIL